MTEPTQKKPENEFDDPLFKVDLVINDKAEVFIFHIKQFSKPLSWLEFNMATRDLDFVLEEGETRNFGVAVPDKYAKHMQNAHQIMMVQMDDKGKPVSGEYFPLILHQEQTA